MADVEQLLSAWLQERFPDDRACTETPGNLETIGRTVRVSRAGGPKFLTLDKARMVFDFWASGGALYPSSDLFPGDELPPGGLSPREAARAWALEVCRALELYLPHAAIGDGVYVTKVDVLSAPSAVPEANTKLRHFAATCTITVRAGA